MENIIFQVIDWSQYHEKEIIEDSDEIDDKEDFLEYRIRLFGRTIDGKSIYVNVYDYKPFFYIKIPNEWTFTKIISLISYIKSKITNPIIIKGFKDYKVIEKKDLYGFTGYKNFKFIKLIFLNMKSYKSFEYWIIKNKIYYPSLFKKPIKLQIYESNIEPFIRCMHIKKLDACGWIKINKYKIYDSSISYCDVSISVNWIDLDFYENNSVQKFIVASFDIECMSESGNFPQACNEGDQIIQIGTVFSYYGESEPFYKNIITLKGCNKIKGLEDVDIECYKDEKKELLAWTKLIQKYNPDFIIGWNINGFDFQYLYDRAKKLQILNEFSKLSKIKNEIAEFKEKQLSSSALGDNLLKYFDMNGRIIIDLMKVTQRDAKLDSYKLDFVAASYIKEKIICYEILGEKSIIYTTSIYGIKQDDYINVSWDDGLSENKHDSKYKIINLEKMLEENIVELYKRYEKYSDYNKYKFKKQKIVYKILINGVIPNEIFDEGNEGLWHNIKIKKSILYFLSEDYSDNNKQIVNDTLENDNVKLIDKVCDLIERPIKGNKIFWTHAKDDISPKELFNLYKGSDDDRGIIAKYCIMDCILVTKIAEKLQVLNNNIGMANVCNVPLSYIFMRGQGVKIFSLVSKKCRELGFLIPKLIVNNKNNDKNSIIDKNNKFHKISKNDSDDEEEIEENIGYEGATVFPPVKGVHYEPIPVLDYASLYPRSMIYINISHECYVNNSQYDNLPDYTYETVNYNNNDGTTTTCRFAKKKDGTKGVLCLILVELLEKRSSTKKLMEKTDDIFLKNIYDGLQLAYKVTANSLYGQVGAPTSPIYMKELAASTTATGRKMLEFSRDFIQGTFGDLINFAIYDKNKYLEISNDLYKNVPIKKFIEPKVGRNTINDFINYFYDKINNLLSNQYRVKPTVIYGDSVTPDTPIILLNDTNNNVEIKNIENIGNIWYEYNAFKSDIDYLTNKQQDENINYKVWTNKGWSKINRVIRHKTNKKIYEIITLQSYVKVTEDHSLLDEFGNQIKPTDCIIGTKLLHNREFEGFKRIYGLNAQDYIQDYINKYMYYPDSTGTINFYFNDKQELNALQIYYACRSLGYYVQIKIENNNNIKKFIISSSKIRPKFYDDFNKIIEINDLGYIDDYVYDLETTIGCFQAGIGCMIVKNTDSVFFSPKIHNIITKEIKTDRNALRVCIEIGKLAGDTICKILPEPEEQVYEKTLWPFIILTKKRYVGNLYEDDDTHYKQKSMGIVLKRRDNAKIVKIVVGGIVDYILNGKPGETNINDRNKGAINYTRLLIKQILRGEYPIDKFIVSKTLRGQYKDRTRIAHAYLADKIGIRDPGNKPATNDRIPYVYVVPKGKVLLQGDRIEDPKYVIQQSLELDYLFYITNQIMKPSIQFLEHIAKNPEKLFENYINKEINRRKNILSIMDYINIDNDDVDINNDDVDINNDDVDIDNDDIDINNDDIDINNDDIDIDNDDIDDIDINHIDIDIDDMYINNINMDMDNKNNYLNYKKKDQYNEKDDKNNNYDNNSSSSERLIKKIKSKKNTSKVSLTIEL